MTRTGSDFLNRLGQILRETRTTCYAWALMPNHFHLLLRSGDAPISIAMRRLRVHAKGDERILGESDFVLQVLKEHNEQLEKRTRMRLGGVDAQRAAARVEEIFGLSFSELSQGSRLRSVVRARSVL